MYIIRDPALRKVTTVLGQWFSTKGNSAHPGYIWKYVVMFLVVMTASVLCRYWHLGGRDQRCCKHPTMHGAAPPLTQYLHRTNSTALEKPCIRGTANTRRENARLCWWRAGGAIRRGLMWTVALYQSCQVGSVIGFYVIELVSVGPVVLYILMYFVAILQSFSVVFLF